MASSTKTQRKLTAILCADVLDYSHLMGSAEAATLRTPTEYREVFAASVERFRGRIANAPGDFILAESGKLPEPLKIQTFCHHSRPPGSGHE